MFQVGGNCQAEIRHKRPYLAMLAGFEPQKCVLKTQSDVLTESLQHLNRLRAELGVVNLQYPGSLIPTQNRKAMNGVNGFRESHSQEWISFSGAKILVLLQSFKSTLVFQFQLKVRLNNGTQDIERRERR